MPSFLALTSSPNAEGDEAEGDGMSFGGLFDGGGDAAGMQCPYGVSASSPALSLARVRTRPRGARFANVLRSVGFFGAARSSDSGRIVCG